MDTELSCWISLCFTPLEILALSFCHSTAIGREPEILQHIWTKEPNISCMSTRGLMKLGAMTCSVTKRATRKKLHHVQRVTTSRGKCMLYQPNTITLTLQVQELMWFETSKTYSPSSSLWADGIFRLLMLLSNTSLYCLMDRSSLLSFIHFTLSSGEPVTLQSKLTGSPTVTLITSGFSTMWGGSTIQTKGGVHTLSNRDGTVEKWELVKHEHTLHIENGKALILSSLINHLAGIFPTMHCFTRRNPKRCYVVLKRSYNLMIFHDPVLIFLPLNGQSWRTCYDTLELCHVTQNSGSVLDLLGKRWWFYEGKPIQYSTVGHRAWMYDETQTCNSD